MSSAQPSIFHMEYHEDYFRTVVLPIDDLGKQLRRIDLYLLEVWRHLRSRRASHLRAAEAAAEVNAQQTHVLHLEVGGVPFHVDGSILLRHPCMLSVMASDDFLWCTTSDSDDHIFLDRDPQYFSLILHFLRSDIALQPVQLLARVALQRELRYYSIQDYSPPWCLYVAGVPAAQRLVPGRPLRYNPGQRSWCERRLMDIGDYVDEDAIGDLHFVATPTHLYRFGQHIHHTWCCLNASTGRWVALPASTSRHTNLSADIGAAVLPHSSPILLNVPIPYTNLLPAGSIALHADNLYILADYFSTTEQPARLKQYQVRKLHVQSGLWSPCRPLGLAGLSRGVAFAFVGDTLFAVGGCYHGVLGQWLSFRAAEGAEAWDNIAQQWVILPDMPDGTAYATAVSWHGRLLVVGGCNGHVGFVRSVFEFSPGCRIWRRLADMCIERARCAMVVLPCGDVIVVGGIGFTYNGQLRWLKTMELYHARTDTWELLPDMPFAFQRLAAVCATCH